MILDGSSGDDAMSGIKTFMNTFTLFTLLSAISHSTEQSLKTLLLTHFPFPRHITLRFACMLWTFVSFLLLFHTAISDIFYSLNSHSSTLVQDNLSSQIYNTCSFHFIRLSSFPVTLSWWDFLTAFMDTVIALVVSPVAIIYVSSHFWIAYKFHCSVLFVWTKA